MHKIYLYKIKIPKGIGNLYQSLENFESKNFSFDITTFNSYLLEVKTYEKIQNKITFFSPDGEKKVIEYESYQNIYFAIFECKKETFLALSNPPRSVRKFFNLLSEIVGNGYTIEPVILNLDLTSQYFFTKYQCDIKYVSVEKFSINHRSYANLEIFSTENAILDAQKLIENQKLLINKVSLHIKNLMKINDLTINSKGFIQTKCFDKSLCLNGSEIFNYIHEILLHREI